MRRAATTVTTLVLAVSAAPAGDAAAAPDAGSLLGWGMLPDRAALGLGSDYATPGPVVLPAGAGPIATAAVGSNVVLAVTRAGDLYVEGRAWATGTGAAQNDPSTVGPRAFALPAATAPVVAVAAGAENAYALTAAGELYGWGLNGKRELGQSSGAYSATPIRIQLPLAAGRIVRIAAGAAHAAAVTDRGEVWAWGADESGQTGQPTATSLPPQRVTAGGLDSEQVLDVVAGDAFTLVRTAAGRAWGFGSDSFGQLGTVPSGGGSHPQPTPTPIALNPAHEPAVAALAAGSYHALALADGAVYSWGRQGVGALGRPVAGLAAPGAVALPDGAGAPVAVAAASAQSFVTTATGQAFGFGDSDVGQLGNPGLPYGSEVGTATPTPVALPAGTTLSRVFAGDSPHSTFFGGATLGLVSNLAVASSALSATAGAPLSATLTATGGDGPYRWSAAGLPGWLTLDAATGALRGTPPAAGPTTFTATVADRFGTEASGAVTVTAAPAPGTPPVPGAPGGTPTTPASPVRSRVRIARVTHAGGTLKVTLSCAGGACAGKLAVTRRVKRRTTSYATKSYKLKAGARGTLRITINKAGAKLLRRTRRLAVLLTVRPSAGGQVAGVVSRKLTLRPAPTPKRRR